MTQAELVAIYNQYIDINISLYQFGILLFFALSVLTIRYLNATIEDPGNKSKKVIFYTIMTLMFATVLVIGYNAFRVASVGGEMGELDEDYEMVEEKYILPYFHSLEPVVYEDLELVERVGLTGGRGHSQYTYHSIGGQLKGKLQTDSKMAKNYDEFFSPSELTFIESPESYSYIEYRKFPFDLDENYNSRFEKTIAYFTLEDMVTLLDANIKTGDFKLHEDFHKKVEAYRESH